VHLCATWITRNLYLLFFCIFFSLKINTVINTFVGTGNIHTRRYMYSENLFFKFSVKIGIAIIAVRLLSFDIFNMEAKKKTFSIYTVYAFFIYSPFSLRQFCRKYESLLLSVFKVILRCFLVDVSYIFLFNHPKRIYHQKWINF
jgi:hypothetical protein